MAMYSLDLEQGTEWTRATAETLRGGLAVFLREAREQQKLPMSSNARLSLAVLVDWLDAAVTDLETGLRGAPNDDDSPDLQPLYDAALPADADGAWIRRAIDAQRRETPQDGSA